MEITTTTMSSKGQIVIPARLRKGFEKGESLLVIKHGDQLIVRRTRDLGTAFAGDLAFAQRTDAALKRYEKGKFSKKESKEFIQSMKKW